MDLTRRAPLRILPALLLVALLLCMCACAEEDAGPSASAASAHTTAQCRQITGAQQAAAPHPAELDLDCGLALARLERWDEAVAAFHLGESKAPRDKRFPIELAGVAFKRKQYAGATADLHRALRLDPADIYANDFLGSVYFLQGNLEAALKYWNRVNKPMLREVEPQPEPRLDPVLLDRAFALAPAELLRVNDLRLSECRLDLLQVFSRYQFELSPREDGSFDLLFHSAERNGFGNSRLETVLNLLRGLPYQTITPEYYNWRGSATNFSSIYRFDAQKRRLVFSFSAPLHRDPKWRYVLYTDMRKENWDLAGAFQGSNAPVGSMLLQKIDAVAEIQSLLGSRWRWSIGFQLSDRQYLQAGFDSSWASRFLADGVTLKYQVRLQGTLLSIPEHHFHVSTAASAQLGRTVASISPGTFGKSEGSIAARWNPGARSDDYEFAAQFRAGDISGRAPFDELFMLGLERDNDLWLRGHIGTRYGMKGNAPMGQHYALANLDFDRVVYRGGFLTVRVGPFLDSGRTYDPYGVLGSRGWLWDTGLQLKLQVLGSVGVVLTYGRDLRGGRNAFYAAP